MMRDAECPGRGAIYEGIAAAGGLGDRRTTACKEGWGEPMALGVVDR